MIDLPPVHDFCTVRQNFAVEVMTKVNLGDLRQIKATYHAYSADPDKELLKRALHNYAQPNPITPVEFGIRELKRCRGEKKY